MTVTKLKKGNKSTNELRLGEKFPKNPIILRNLQKAMETELS